MKGVVNRRDGQRMTVPSLHYTLHLACFTFTSPLPFFTRILFTSFIHDPRYEGAR